jgi:two-component system response regulator RegX3
MQVLLVEDDDSIADPLTTGLEREGFTVARVATGNDALRDYAGAELILLDLGLPDTDGYAVCRTIRAESDVPIIVITARGEEVDRVIGLELGADDYLVKPFGFRELVARMRAVTRRAGGPGAQPEEVTEVGPLRVDRRARRVHVDGDEVDLTRKEFDVLAHLTSDVGATHSRDSIMEAVWDAHWYGPTKTLDVHMTSLRRKLGVSDLIETVRGVGFRIPGEDDAS